MDGDESPLAFWEGQLRRCDAERLPPFARAHVLRRLAEVRFDTGDDARARTALADLAKLQGASDDPGVDAFHNLALADVARREGATERAAWLGKQAERHARRSGNVEALVYTMSGLGELSSALGDREEARRAYAAAFELFEADGMLRQAIPMLLRTAYFTPGEARAPLLKQACALAERSEEADLRVLTRHIHGQALGKNGAYLPARRTLEQALALCRAEVANETSSVLASLAELETNSGRHEEALALAAEALEAAKTGDERGNALVMRVIALGRLHRHREARRVASAASREFKAMKKPDAASANRSRAAAERLLTVCHLLPGWRCPAAEKPQPEYKHNPMSHVIGLLLGAGIGLSVASLHTLSTITGATTLAGALTRLLGGIAGVAVGVLVLRLAYDGARNYLLSQD